jgi:hypothetical protein
VNPPVLRTTVFVDTYGIGQIRIAVSLPDGSVREHGFAFEDVAQLQGFRERIDWLANTMLRNVPRPNQEGKP